MMETVAFYRESIIKTYGFVERIGLTLWRARIPSTLCGQVVARFLQEMARREHSVLLLTVRPLGETNMEVSLLTEKTTGEESIPRRLKEIPEEFRDPEWRVEKEVELVSFQGPHYGDRYGIAYAALEAVFDRGVPMLAMACIGATVFLVLPRGQAAAARKALERSFTVPRERGGL